MIEIGEMRAEFEKGEAKKLEEIINENFAKKSYYIFKHSNWIGNDSNIMKSTYMLRSSLPPKMLGTVLWLVDNEKGALTQIWDLPLDLKIDPTLFDPGTALEGVHNSMKGVEGAILLS